MQAIYLCIETPTDNRTHIAPARIWSNFPNNTHLTPSPIMTAQEKNKNRIFSRTQYRNGQNYPIQEQNTLKIKGEKKKKEKGGKITWREEAIFRAISPGSESWIQMDGFMFMFFFCWEFFLKPPERNNRRRIRVGRKEKQRVWWYAKLNFHKMSNTQGLKLKKFDKD